MRRYFFPLYLEKYSFPLKSCLGHIDHDVTGIYIVFENANVLYVGMSLKVDRRISYIETNHHQLPSILKHHPKALVHIIEFPWWELKIVDLNWDQEKFMITGELRDFERAAIQYYRPKYNRT